MKYYNTDKYLKCGCMNRYHTECLYEWIKCQNKCPICREKITELQNDNSDNNIDNNNDDNYNDSIQVDDNDFFYSPIPFIFMELLLVFLLLSLIKLIFIFFKVNK